VDAPCPSGSIASIPQFTRGVLFTPDNGLEWAAVEAPGVAKVGTALPPSIVVISLAHIAPSCTAGVSRGRRIASSGMFARSADVMIKMTLAFLAHTIPFPQSTD
jgi:hypothetical protein